MNVSFQQMEDLWQALRKESDPVRSPLLMVELAKLLLKYAYPDEERIQELSRNDQLTDFLIEYLDTAERLKAFFEQALPHLHPDDKGGDFEKEIQETKADLEQVQSRIRNLKTRHVRLLEQKDRLRAEVGELKELEDTLKGLQEMEQKLRAGNMEQLREEVQALREKTGARLPEFEALQMERDRQQTALQHMEEMLRQVREGEGNFPDRFTTLADQLIQTLDNAWDKNDLQLTRKSRILLQKIRQYEKITSKLDACLRQIGEVTESEKVNFDIYQRHFAANRNITGASETGKVGDIREVSTQIAGLLKAFDERLREAVNTQEEAIRQIRRLNTPSS